jgi:DNA excision repair protein ERCC-6
VQQADRDDDSSSDDGEEYGDEESLAERSGKLEVLAKILPLWHAQGHRVLIFCQWRKMLSIIQRFTMQKGWRFGRLDGATSVAARQRLVDTFNNDKDSYFGMLCTTRTGGVGLNLTGANRIILYDPDWNPMTGTTARSFIAPYIAHSTDSQSFSKCRYTSKGEGLAVWSRSRSYSISSDLFWNN